MHVREQTAVALLHEYLVVVDLESECFVGVLSSSSPEFRGVLPLLSAIVVLSLLSAVIVLVLAVTRLF